VISQEQASVIIKCGFKTTSGAVGNSWSRSGFIMQLLALCNHQLSPLFPLGCHFILRCVLLCLHL